MNLRQIGLLLLLLAAAVHVAGCAAQQAQAPVHEPERTVTEPIPASSPAKAPELDDMAVAELTALLESIRADAAGPAAYGIDAQLQNLTVGQTLPSYRLTESGLQLTADALCPLRANETMIALVSLFDTGDTVICGLSAEPVSAIRGLLKGTEPFALVYTQSSVLLVTRDGTSILREYPSESGLRPAAEFSEEERQVILSALDQQSGTEIPIILGS